MFNLFRMDIRRLFRNRSFYIMLGVTAVWIVGMILLLSMVSDPEIMETIQSDSAEIDLQESTAFRTMPQLEFTYECLSNGFLLVMTGIGMTLFVNSDFSSGYIKNICFARPKRRDYVLSKILLTGVYSCILTILGILICQICPILFGMHLTAAPVIALLQYMFWLWLPHWAFGLMALVLVLLTRSSTLGIVLAVVSGGGVTAAVLHLVCQRLNWPPLEQYLLSSVEGNQCIPMLGMQQMGMILACALGWAAVYGIGSLVLMEKRDI